MRGFLLLLAAWQACPAGAAEKPGAPLSGEVTLQRTVDFALKNNPLIREALYDIQRTRGQYLEVRSEALPTVSATGTYRQESN